MSSKPLSYYVGLLTSEYQNAPNLKAFLTALLTPIDDLNACLDGMNEAYDLQANIGAAQGTQLDVLGQLIGVTRNLPFQPLGVNALTTAAITSTGLQAVTTNNTTYMNTSFIEGLLIIDGGNPNQETVHPTLITPGVGFTANFTKTHVISTTVTGPGLPPTLGDDDYRVLLYAKIGQNEWDGTIESLYPIWQTIFPTGRIVIQDNQDMTATLILTGAFSALSQQMITNGLIVPRPEGVLYNYTFGTLPLFGFDRDDTYVAGWDTGHWA